MENTIMELLRKNYFPIQEKFNDICLGGSLSLMLQGLMPQRTPHDIDLVSFRYRDLPIELSSLFDKSEFKGSPPSGGVGPSVKSNFTNSEGIVFDLFICSLDQYDYKYIKIEDMLIRVIEPQQIIDAKVSYALKGGNSGEKHAKDIVTIFSNLNSGIFIPRETTNKPEADDLPF
jgi:hypothetical protein